MLDKVNILLVDDQPAKLLTYEVILRELDDHLLKAASAKEALELLLKNEIAVVLMDVCMPELDGFELASMIREHPRFQKVAMIFISAVHLAEIDHLRGYEMGAVDYVPVPVVPEVLRAKVRVFADLYRKTRQLEQLNVELERRVAQRTAELEASTMQLIESEQRRSLALAAGQMGSWDWNLATGEMSWDAGQYSIYGMAPGQFTPTPEYFNLLALPDDRPKLRGGMQPLLERGEPYQAEFRIVRPSGEVRWCVSTATASLDGAGRVIRVAGVTLDVTDRKGAEERQALLAREVDHRAKNAMAIVQSFVRLTKADNVTDYANVIEGRIKALSRAHAILSDSRWQGADLAKLVDEELAPYRSGGDDRISVAGAHVVLDPTTAQTLALALHELATNGTKYGALSRASGKLAIKWQVQADAILIDWRESGGPPTNTPRKTGFGTKIITSSIERQLGGRAEFNWRREGLACLLRVPRDLRVETNGNGGVATAGFVSPQALPGRRVLIVEDEALVAMMLEEELESLGLSIVANCGSVSDAVKAIDSKTPDAAILDVNLGGELVYPVADCLLERGIPFVFLTGYGRESVDQRYQFIQILEKPVGRQVLETVFATALAEPEASNVTRLAARAT
jgi:two-component sensor histidine kinase/two-component SAPR family response regulator